MDNKRLYKSSVNYMLCGVCGGIAEYFGIDATIVRIGWILATLISFGTALLAYLICWAVMPNDPE